MAKERPTTRSQSNAPNAEQPELAPVEPDGSLPAPTAAQISAGIPIPPARQIEIYSPEDWERFTEEWLTYHRTAGEYKTVRRMPGPGDRGIDVVGFTTDDGFNGPWDSFQCKHYSAPLGPDTLYGEIGKLIYYSYLKASPFDGPHRVPRTYIFVSPRGSGITVSRLIKNPDRLKEDIRAKWDERCAPKLGKGIEAPMEGNLLEYFDSFDFSIFGDKSSLELIEEHSKTRFHIARFGGGLPPRSKTPKPPTVPTAEESLYLQKLLDAYADYLGLSDLATEDLARHAALVKDYDRQRVRFYSAEALRNFARDRTPPNTFESLQEEIFDGVVDVYEGSHPSALDRLRQVLLAAAALSISGNALVSVTQIRDKQGVCHQLANDDRLDWVEAT